MTLPPCGLYKTSAPIGPVPAGRLVFFHNHGDPGPGVYLPEAWEHNRARFSKQGTTLEDVSLAESLEPLLPEGLYRVVETFACCEKQCRTFERDLLVQLGYNGRAEPILFLPEWTSRGLAIPLFGQIVDPLRLEHVEQLIVSEAAEPEAPTIH